MTNVLAMGGKVVLAKRCTHIGNSVANMLEEHRQRYTIQHTANMSPIHFGFQKIFHAKVCHQHLGNILENSACDIFPT